MIMCVIDSTGNYIDCVMVSADGKPMFYTMPDDCKLIDAEAPQEPDYAGADGYIRPKWDGSAWAEGASAEEIEAWNAEHPVPTETVSQLDRIEAQVAYTAMMTDTLLGDDADV